MSGEQRPLVSVVVTTKNEERKLEFCLRGISLQTYAPIETIVVDNGSADRTKEIARKFTDEVFDRGPERSAQRNYGMLIKAKGKYVVYLDADMIPAPDLIDACVKRMSQGDCVALHISEVVLGRSHLSRVRRFERQFYDGTVIDAARFFCRDVFCEVGGFDESMTGVEDWDLDKKVKGVGPIAFLNQDPYSYPPSSHWDLAPFIEERGVDPSGQGAVIYHDESELSLPVYLRKKYYYSNWFAGYLTKWGHADPDVAKQFGLRYRYFEVFIEDGKWRSLLAHPRLTVGMLFLRVLVGAAYLTKKIRAYGD